MVRNKKVMCSVCYREMRSDNLPRHLKQHEKINEDNPDTITYATNNVYNSTLPIDSTQKIEMKSEIYDEELRKHLIKLENDYQEKIALGKGIYKMVGEGIVSFQALSNDMKDAVETYTQHQEDFRDVGNVELKPWQDELMQYIIPCDREIFWIVGKDGNEGKSWFQKYVKSMFGTRRVVTGIDIKSSNASIFQDLRKRPLVTADIFLFNIGKSMKKFDEINYDALEKLKDGEAFASKFNSQQLKIRVPNVVMVFSNSPPNFKELANKRFRVFYIKNDELKGRKSIENESDKPVSKNKTEDAINQAQSVVKDDETSDDNNESSDDDNEMSDDGGL